MNKKKNETEIKLYSDLEAERLADAIILQAVKDYRNDKVLKRYIEGDIISLGKFFNSEYAEQLGRGSDIQAVFQRLRTEPIQDEYLKELFKRLDNVFEYDRHHLTVVKNGKFVMIIGLNVASIERSKEKILSMIEAVDKEMGFIEDTAQNGTNTDL